MIERKRRNDFVRKREFDMLRKVRREGLTSEQLAATDPQLEGQAFANEPGVLLAPDLNVIVNSASQLYAQVGDVASKQLTQPRATPMPTPSPRP